MHRVCMIFMKRYDIKRDYLFKMYVQRYLESFQREAIIQRYATKAVSEKLYI